MATSPEIEDWRRKIDEVDTRLLELINRRVEFALQIGRLKREAGIPVYNREREEQIHENLRRNNRGPLDNEAVQRLFAGIIEETRRLEHQACNEGTGDGNQYEA